VNTAIPPAPDASRRPPAPGRLELLRTFLNTVDLESGHDDLGSPEALASWLADRDLLAPGGALQARDLARAKEFREALRDVMETNDGHGEAADANARLDAVAAATPLRLRMADGPTLVPARGLGVDRAIGTMLAIVYESVAQGTWPRMKVCRNDTCRWAFYDSSRNRSGTWCTMAICGNRMKGRAFRRRHPAGATSA
jgi:predicted RNA-binding Zn ribbon-like protein